MSDNSGNGGSNGPNSQNNVGASMGRNGANLDVVRRTGEGVRPVGSGREPQLESVAFGTSRGNGGSGGNGGALGGSAGGELVASRGLRQDLVEKAIGFLTHPKVADTPLGRRRDFLREKKGMTEAEIDEAVRRAGVTETTTGFIPPSSSSGAMVRQSRHQPHHEEWGWASIFAGVVALASLAVAGVYAYSNFTQGGGSGDRKKSKKDKGSKKTPAKGSSTPSTSKKKKDGSPKSAKKSVAAVLPPKEKEEISQDVAVAVASGASEDSAKFSAELERLMNLVEENNRQKFELVRSSAGADESLKADVQTIKQLLLTRQQIGGAALIPVTSTSVVAATAPVIQQPQQPPPSREELVDGTAPAIVSNNIGPATNTSTGGSNAPLAATTTTTTTTATSTPSSTSPTTALTGSSGGPTLPTAEVVAQTPPSAKPWEVRRRNRLDLSSSTNVSVAPLTTSEITPVTTVSTPASATTTTTTTTTATLPGSNVEENN